MEPLARLSLRYRDPAVLGLSDAAELTRLLRTLTDVEGPDERVYHAALAELIGLEIAQLTRTPEEFSAPGQVSVTQGLAVRLRSLRAERRASLQRSGSLLPGRPGVTSAKTEVRW